MTTSQDPTDGSRTATASYRAARDQLLVLRGDQAQAVEEFRSPDVAATRDRPVGGGGYGTPAGVA